MPQRFDPPSPSADRIVDEVVLPVAEERVIVGKRRRAVARVHVRLRTVPRTAPWTTELAVGAANVERVHVGREVDVAPPVRREGDRWIIPIVDEIPVVVKRLYLREELHVVLHTDMERRDGEIVLRQIIPKVAREPIVDDIGAIVQETSVTRKITAVFETAPAAERARERLVDAGVTPSSISIIHIGQNVADDERKRHRGWLSALFGANEDRAAYEEGLRRGDHLLTALVDPAQADAAIRVLDNSDAIDFDARQDQWRAGGWDPNARRDDGDRDDETMRGAVLAEAGVVDKRNKRDRVAGDSLDTDATQRTAVPPTGAGALTGDAEAFPIVQERLRVGKRDVSGGGVRVRSYVVETPVEEIVTLREQYVDIDRRPLNRPLNPGEVEGVFRDREITATEHREEPVVAREAVVTEEVVVRQRKAERAEPVRDTVRRTEVEVDRDDKRRLKGDIPPGGGTTGGNRT